MDITQLDKEEQETIVNQYEAVRRSGQTNMLNKTAVQRIAFDNDLYELVNFIDGDDYGSLLQNYAELQELIDEDNLPEIN